MKLIKILFLFLVSIIFLQSNVLAGSEPVTYTLTATATGTGSGRVSSTRECPDGIVTTTPINFHESVVSIETVSEAEINYTYPGIDTGATEIPDYCGIVLTATANPGSSVSWTTCGGAAGGTPGGSATVATCTYPPFPPV